MAGTKRKRGGKKGGGRARRSRYVGVSWHKGAQKWLAGIMVRGVQQHLGYFDDEADGARAYDAAVAAQNLRYPRNFPGDTGAGQAVKARDNRSAIPDKGKSRFVGVCWNKREKKWKVQVKDKGKNKGKDKGKGKGGEEEEKEEVASDVPAPPPTKRRARSSSRKRKGS